MQFFKKIITGLSVTVLAASCGAWLLFGWSGTGWKALTIPTSSMRPTMPPGSLVFVHRVPTSSLKVGDVITYNNPLHPSTTISHRIIKKYLIGGKIPGFVTKGDANPTPDRPIAAGSVDGQVAWHVSHVGSWLLDAKKPIVILPVIYIAALLITIEEVQRLRDYYKLGLPYRVPGFARASKQPNTLARRASMGAMLTAAFVVVGAAAGPSAAALLQTNTVTLANNKISIAAAPTGGGKCSDNSKNVNNVSVNNSTTQTARSGNATTSNGGTATSGSATNNSSTDININATNC